MIRFHELATAEAIEAQNWYANHSIRAALKFRRQLDVTIDRILAAPDQFPAILKKFQYARIFSFPYVVVYHRSGDGETVVLAIAHTRRRSGYWSNRG